MELREQPVLPSLGERGSKAETHQVLLKGMRSQPLTGLRDSCRMVSRTYLSPSCPACHPSSQWIFLLLTPPPSSQTLPQLAGFPVAPWKGTFSGIQTRCGGLGSPSGSMVITSVGFRVNRLIYLLCFLHKPFNCSVPQFPHLIMG